MTVSRYRQTARITSPDDSRSLSESREVARWRRAYDALIYVLPIQLNPETVSGIVSTINLCQKHAGNAGGTITCKNARGNFFYVREFCPQPASTFPVENVARNR